MHPIAKCADARINEVTSRLCTGVGATLPVRRLGFRDAACFGVPAARRFSAAASKDTTTTRCRQANNSTLMFCEMLSPVPNTAGSSVRMISSKKPRDRVNRQHQREHFAVAPAKRIERPQQPAQQPASIAL